MLEGQGGERTGVGFVRATLFKARAIVRRRLLMVTRFSLTAWDWSPANQTWDWSPANSHPPQSVNSEIVTGAQRQALGLPARAGPTSLLIKKLQANRELNHISTIALVGPSEMSRTTIPQVQHQPGMFTGSDSYWFHWGMGSGRGRL